MTEDDLYLLLRPLAGGQGREAFSLAALGNFLDYYGRGRRRSLRSG